MTKHPVDMLIREYADRLQTVYDDRTAGDFTFSGILAEFAVAIFDGISAESE